MCRSIKILRNADREPSEMEIHEASLQFVRKISGYRHPSQANTEAFNKAVSEIAVISRQLLGDLVSRTVPPTTKPS